MLCLPSKRTALFAPLGGTLIARSDTNGEDLEGFAGAGLYDSVAAVDLREAPVDLAAEPLMWDAGLQQQVRGGEGEMRPWAQAGQYELQREVWGGHGGGPPGLRAPRDVCVCGGGGGEGCVHTAWRPMCLARAGGWGGGGLGWGVHWTCASANALMRLKSPWGVLQLSGFLVGSH